MRSLIPTPEVIVNRTCKFLADIPPDDLLDLLYIHRIQGDREIIEPEWLKRKKGDKSVFSQMATGMTKIVLFPKEYPDIVVKIPFFGTDLYRYADDGDSLELYDRLEFSDDADGDYCNREANLYELACKAGVEDFFAKTEYIGTAMGFIPVYVSERCTPFTGDTESTDCRMFRNSDVPIEIVKALHEQHSSEELDDLIRFIENFGIYDLHGENWGISQDNQVRIIDYSGFFEEYSNL